MKALLARVGDRINPIVVKEARQAVGSRLVSVALLLFLMVQLAVMALAATGREYSGDPDDLDMRAGREVFQFVQATLLGTCMLLIPALTAGRLAGERSDVRVDLLFITSLSPRQIMAGKFLAAGALALLIFSACAPFMTFAYVLRGLDIPTILAVLGADLIAVLFGTMFALLLASVPVNRGLKAVLGLVGFIALCYLFAGAVAATSDFLRHGSRADTAGWEFWAGFAALAAAVIGLTGLLFVWATALISPPTANRALPVRVYTLALWLATAAGCGFWSHYITEPYPVIAWTMFWAALFSFQILIASGERDGWGPRVARRIPRNPLARVPAFFLYSGAAGGLGFAALGGALTVLGVVAWHESVPSSGWPTRWWEVPQVAGLVLAYTYCYCLTATLFRQVFRGRSFHAEHTWVVAMIFCALGFVVPYIVQFSVFDSRYHHRSHWDEIYWLFLPNPAAMIDDSLERWQREGHAELTWLFLAAWGAVVTLLNARWLFRQVANFRPRRAAEVGVPALAGAGTSTA